MATKFDAIMARANAEGLPLTFSHLVELAKAKVPSEEARETLIQRALSESLSVRKLTRIIRPNARKAGKDGAALTSVLTKATAAFMTIINRTDTPVLITGGTCPVAQEIRPMITTKQANGVMGMAVAESFAIPAKGQRVFEPGGDHIMLMNLKEVPKAGSTVALVLTTESGGKAGAIHLDVPVR